jgi:ADP-L-glycero-D-manno-heptose 6-epimerase
MIVVTGAEGFIGKNLVCTLRSEYIDVVEFDVKSQSLDFIYGWLMKYAKEIDAIIHLGAITDTLEMNKGLFDTYNVESTIFIWNLCTEYQIPLIYASSAATYGDGEQGFDDEKTILNLEPLNPYGWSKQQFDVWVEGTFKQPPFWYGLKFFNVYGYGEAHKGKMASMVYHMFNQIDDSKKVKLFKSHRPDYGHGEQKRDFVYVDDIVDVCLFLYKEKPNSGIYNVGTGKARSFNDLANAVFMALGYEKKITYIDTPLAMRDKYQYFTEAKIDKLRGAGYNKPFHELEEGVFKYINKLKYENS